MGLVLTMNMEFRNKLKSFTRDSHVKLESQKDMLLYSSGNLSPEQYRNILAKMAHFWNVSSPKNSELSSRFHELLHDYRETLLADAGVELPLSGERQVRYEEVSFFYLLLGSSHGAKVMRARLKKTGLPITHLDLLAERGFALWPLFVESALESVPPESENLILNSSAAMFECLYSEMEKESAS